MSDDFEDTLRQRLREAVPPASGVPGRAAGANFRAKRARRNRRFGGAAVLAAVAAVTTAVIVVPALLTDESPGPAQTAAESSMGPTKAGGPGWHGGRIVGRLQSVGGPAGTANQPLPGWITLTDDGGQTIRFRAGEHGFFHGQLPVGSYAVAGHSRLYESGQWPCNTVRPTVTVSANRTTHVSVWCQEK